MYSFNLSDKSGLSLEAQDSVGNMKRDFRKIIGMVEF